MTLLRVVSVLLYGCFFVANGARGQAEFPTKIYFQSAESISLITTLDLNQPLQVSGTTLLEMASDSLSIQITQDRLIPFYFDPLQTYSYFLEVSLKGSVSINPMRKNGFWPSRTDRYKAKTYRRYYWDKERGLRLVVERM